VIEPPPIPSIWVAACIAHFDDDLVVVGPKCNTVDCAESAVAIVRWPTASVRCCERCTAMWREVAACGLGMHLHVEPIF
jgi:hypothetical protein